MTSAARREGGCVTANMEETTVRKAIARAARMQRRLQQHLEDVLASVPPSPREEEIYEQGLAYDFPTEVRSCLECILEDWMRPASQDLKKLSVWRPGERPVH